MAKKSRREARLEFEAKKKRRNQIILGVGGFIVAIVILLLLFNPFPQDGDDLNEPGLLEEDQLSEQVEDQPREQVDDQPRALENVPPAERNGYYAEYPPMTIDPAKDYSAILRTEKGDMTLRLFAEESPLTVNNFVYLSRQGYFDGLSFHRVLQDFMAQGGDPTGQGGGGPGYQFEDETNNGLAFDRPGLLAMANRGPATNGSQFFITYVPTPHLNGLHTIFGEMVSGEETLNALSLVLPDGVSPSMGDLIQRIDIIEE